MKIKFHKNFKKQFDKLSDKKKRKVLDIINVFINNPKDKKLKNHNLKGRLIGKKAISVSPNLRIIFEEYDNYLLVIFLDLGGHNHVYG